MTTTKAPDDFDEDSVPDEAVRIELPEFEGPLDLLLHLIKKHELEIVNIPISLITEKYLEYIGILQALNLDIAGEYLLMAATLAWLKSRELVPSTDDEEEALAAEGELAAIDAKAELIKRLLEYQKFKEAARSLGERPVVGRNVWPRGTSIADVTGIRPGEHAPLEEVPVFRLIEALESVLKRARVELTHDVVVERISITDKINELVDRLAREPSFTFASCFAFVDSAASYEELRHQVVITFMALLEMTRLKLVRLHQAGEFGDIYLTGTGVAPPTKIAEDV